jgi:GNAT superfamily N-acetyltransferase
MTLVMIHTAHYMTSVMTIQLTPPGDGGSGSPWSTDGLILLAAARPANISAVLRMMSRCSRSTLFHRFHGYTDGIAYTRRLLEGQVGHQTLVAWRNGSCIGLATLTIDTDGRAELAVLVEDAWQRRGVGTRMVEALLERARTAGIPSVHADVLGEDMFILSLLRRIGPVKVSADSGTFSVDVDLLSTECLVRRSRPAAAAGGDQTGVPDLCTKSDHVLGGKPGFHAQQG